MKTSSAKNKILNQTGKFVREYFSDEGTGHDWWHIFRVRKLALTIAEKEGGNLFFIEMAALLHDLEDWKLEKKNQQPTIREVLNKMKVAADESRQISQIIEQVSFKGAGTMNKTTSMEAQIVQDADRLDAMGAIGIARTFAYGGNKGRLIYDPDVAPQFHTDFESYKKGEAPTINHFYEKLLLLKDRLNTATAKKMAQSRHDFMETFLKQFFNEWENKI